LARRGHEVRLYADSPYYLHHGLPSWLSTQPNAEADLAISAALDDLGVDRQRLVRRAVRLSDESVAAKMAAMRAYLTEMEPVNTYFGGIARDSELMRHETYWDLRAG
jgi:hypothetical protein